jgi:hypothetical protein
MPALRTSEDVALYRALVRAGERFRHSERVRVFTSARAFGRAEGGLADAIACWQGLAQTHTPVMVESATAADERLRKLGRWVYDSPGTPPPDLLSATPPPTPDTAAEIHRTLHELRARIAALRPLRLIERLAISSPARVNGWPAAGTPADSTALQTIR